MGQITGKIEDVFVEKEGTGAKGKWTLSAVIINGEKYKTFKGEKYQVGKSGTFEYTEDKFGKTLQEPKKAFQDNNEVIARLTTIEDLCLNITKMLSQQKTVKIDDGKGGFTTSPVEEIDIEDIPFK